MTPYEEIAAPSDLHADCEAVNRQLAKAAVQATRPAPSIHFDEFPLRSCIAFETDIVAGRLIRTCT